MYGIGMQELLLILVIVVLIFGSKKLPEIGGGLGKAIRNFKRASSEPDEIDITPKDEKKKDDTTPSAIARSDFSSGAVLAGVFRQYLSE